MTVNCAFQPTVLAVRARPAAERGVRVHDVQSGVGVVMRKA